MTTHIAELREIVKSSSSAEKKLDWSSVESRIKDQVVLRGMTCVQIASKVTSHYKVNFLMNFAKILFEETKVDLNNKNMFTHMFTQS